MEKTIVHHLSTQATPAYPDPTCWSSFPPWITLTTTKVNPKYERWPIRLLVQAYLSLNGQSILIIATLRYRHFQQRST